MNTTTLPPEPECRRSWDQDGDTPTCPAWITARDIHRAERRELKADNALRELHSGWWRRDPEGRERRCAELDSQVREARQEIRALLNRRSRCTCTGPDMPR